MRRDATDARRDSSTIAVDPVRVSARFAAAGKVRDQSPRIDRLGSIRSLGSAWIRRSARVRGEPGSIVVAGKEKRKIFAKVEEAAHDETDDERMSRGRRGIRRRPVARRRAEERLREGRVAERVKGGTGPMVYDDLMGRVMSRVVGTLLKSVAAALVVLSCCRCTRASEFPERECCDLIFPIPEPTGRSTSAPTPTGRSGESSFASFLP